MSKVESLYVYEHPDSPEKYHMNGWVYEIENPVYVEVDGETCVMFEDSPIPMSCYLTLTKEEFDWIDYHSTSLDTPTPDVYKEEVARTIHLLDRINEFEYEDEAVSEACYYRRGILKAHRLGGTVEDYFTPWFKPIHK